MNEKSRKRLATCVPPLQELFNKVAEVWDIIVIYGHRGQEDQDIAWRLGNTKLKWPNSNHNRWPSCAVDVMPLPLDWSDTGRLKLFADYVKDTALMLDIPVRWGGDFKNFYDGPHWEISPGGRA